MEGEKKNYGEGVPLNSSGAANIFLNTGKKNKSSDGTVIHLNTEKPSDVGVHINTTLSIASSKKIKLLFMLNFLLSVICMIVSCTIAFYYWNEMISMRRQLDVFREQLLIQNVRDDMLQKTVPSPLVSNLRPQDRLTEFRESRELVNSQAISPNARKYFVEDLGEDMVFVDSNKKKPSQEKVPVYDFSMLKKEPVVAHFNGAINEKHMGLDAHIGPWEHDHSASTKDSESTIQVNTNSFLVKESGLYLFYAQIVYISHEANCFFVWTGRNQKLRQITTCATADYYQRRPLKNSQLSCSVQVVARLTKDDNVLITQREENRTLLLKPGYSYVGFVKLSS